MSTPDTNERIVGYRTAAEDFLGTAKEDLSASESVYISRLVASLADAGSQTILRYRNEDVTANELLASIYRYARALATLGIGRGSLVALFAPNCPDAIAVRYAANLIASAAVYLPLPATSERRAELVAQMAPDLLVVFPQTTGLVPAGTSARIASVGVSVAGASVRLDNIASEQGSEAFPCAARPDDLAIVLSSGGTMGVPKGSRRNFMAYSAMVNVPSSPDRRQLVNGHFAYLSQVLVDVTLLGGGCVVLRDAYDAADTLATIESERITDLFLVEPQLFEVMDHPDVSRRDLSSLRTLNHVGASAPPTLRIRAQERLGPVIAHTYGASEEGLVSMLTPAEHDPLRATVLHVPAESFLESKYGYVERTARWRRSVRWGASKSGHPLWHRVIAIDPSSKQKIFGTVGIDHATSAGSTTKATSIFLVVQPMFAGSPAQC